VAEEDELSGGSCTARSSFSSTFLAKRLIYPYIVPFDIFKNDLYLLCVLCSNREESTQQRVNASNPAHPVSNPTHPLWPSRSPSPLLSCSFSKYVGFLFEL
jgi:hypothetical protein